MPVNFQAISNRLFAKLPTTKRIEVVELLDITGGSPAVKGFLEMEIEIAVGADLERLRTHFELPQAIDDSGYRLLNQGLVRMGTVSREDAKKLIVQSVADAARYLSSPRSFLLQLLGSESNLLLDDVFFRSLHFLTEYEYFPDMLRMWGERLRADGHTSIPREQFEEVLARVDRGMIANHTFDRIEELLLPLAILFNGGIPKDALVDYFSDKGMRRVAATIASLRASTISIAEIQHVLLDVHSNQTGARPGGLNRQLLLADLRAAGVVIAPDTESRLLSDIATRSASSGEEAEHKI
jgi:hypothetical protein